MVVFYSVSALRQTGSLSGCALPLALRRHSHTSEVEKRWMDFKLTPTKDNKKLEANAQQKLPCV